jgi:spermidine synthase
MRGLFETRVSTVLKPVKSGSWKLRRETFDQPFGGYEIWTKDGMRRMRTILPIKGVILMRKGNVWMSDTPLEISTAMPFVERAYGHVLEVGLGIGLTTTLLLNHNRRMKSLTIVEKHMEVIDMVAPKLYLPKSVHVVCMDIDEFVSFAGKWKDRFDSIHYDIWPTRNQALDDVRKAKKQMAPLLRKGGFTYVWLEELARLVEQRMKLGPSVSGGFGFFPPCFSCGKTLRNDYYGLCMDCADCLGFSELFIKRSVE